MKLGRLLLRVTVGGLFVGHGTQKLFGWFGGHGLDATANMFESIGMRPGNRNAIAAGVAEAGGGAALAAGFATPLAAATLTSVMLTAINRVHLKNGPWVTNGGYEYNAVLIAAVLALAEVGPGELSLDHALGQERSGPGWAVLALALGIAGAVGAHIAAEATPAPPAPPEPPSPGEAATYRGAAAPTESQEAGTAQ
jgi:putative oxidoreductase